jgi:hypothetical protein
MGFNFRTLFFALLFFCLAHVLLSQDDGADSQYRMAFAWTKDNYALRYEVLFEREENGEYHSVLREFTEETFIFISLPPGHYRSRVIPYDFRDVPGKGTEWKKFRVLAVIGSDTESRLVMDDASPLPEQEEGTMSINNMTENKDSTPPENHRSLFVALLAEGLGYTRYSAAFGGGIMFGNSFNNKGIGISLLYAQDAENFIFLEALAHFRLYLLRAQNNTGLFLQAEGGIVSFAYEKLEFTGHFAPSAGLCAGWRFPLGTRWYMEPCIRGGYPYILGAGLSAGMRFDHTQVTADL